MLYAVPATFERYLSEFSSLSYHQRRLVAQYVTGLVAARSKSALGISRSVVGSHHKALERLLVEYPVDCWELNRERLTLLQGHNETRSSKRGVLIIDDVGVEKEMRDAYTYYDHASGEFKRGFVIVTLSYCDHKVSYPVDMELYLPRREFPQSYRSKIDLAIAMLERLQGELSFTNVVFDSWYANRRLHEYLKGKGKRWVARLRSNLLAKYRGRYYRLAELAEEFRARAKRKCGRLLYSRVLYLKSLRDYARVVFVYDGEETLLLASSDCSLTIDAVLRYYEMRWSIEVFHRDAKQHLGLAEWKVRSLEGAKRHWHLLMLAYSLLRLGAASEEMVKSIFSSAGKSIAKQVRIYSFIAMIHVIFLATQKGLKFLVAEFLRAGGIGMGIG